MPEWHARAAEINLNMVISQKNWKDVWLSFALDVTMNCGDSMFDIIKEWDEQGRSLAEFLNGGPRPAWLDDCRRTSDTSVDTPTRDLSAFGSHAECVALIDHLGCPWKGEVPDA